MYRGRGNGRGNGRGRFRQDGTGKSHDRQSDDPSTRNFRKNTNIVKETSDRDEWSDREESDTFSSPSRPTNKNWRQRQRTVNVVVGFESLDIKKFLSNLVEFCNTNVQTESPSRGINPMFIVDLKQYLVEQLIPIGIRYKLEDVNEDSTSARLLLCTDRNTANFRVPLVRQANGILISLSHTSDLSDTSERTLKPELLVMSSNEFSMGHAAIDVEQFLREGVYDIYPVQDGTTFNMYYWNGSWLKSTRNSFDISELVWRNAKYETVINECFAEYPKFNLKLLNTSMVYTFGYKHHDHHPFLGDAFSTGKPRRKMWLVNVFDKAAMKNVSLDSIDIGIPAQLKLSNIDTTNNQNVYGMLTAKCESALSNYLSLRDISRTEGGTLENDAFLGYILRSNDPRAIAVSDILLESSLFTEIKKCIYDMPYIRDKQLRTKAKVNFSNMNYVIVSSWLDFSKRSIFFNLFPQYKAHSTRYDTLTKRALAEISEKILNGSSSSNANIFSDNNDDNIVAILSAKLMVHLQYDIDKTLAADSSRLYNLVMNPALTELYVEALCMHE